jgi:hypothetical protein
MKCLLPTVFAVVLCAACLLPASASAYYYHGRYYRYRKSSARFTYAGKVALNAVAEPCLLFWLEFM